MGEQHKATEQGPNAAVAQIIAKAAGVEAEDIGPEKRLVEDLGIDSLTAITLAVQLEQSTKVRIEESDAQMFRRIGVLAPLTRPEIGELVPGGCVAVNEPRASHRREHV